MRSLSFFLLIHWFLKNYRKEQTTNSPKVTCSENRFQRIESSTPNYRQAIQSWYAIYHKYEIKATSNYSQIEYLDYLNLKNKKPPKTTNEKHTTASTTRNLQIIFTNKIMKLKIYLEIELERPESWFMKFTQDMQTSVSGTLMSSTVETYYTKIKSWSIIVLELHHTNYNSPPMLSI